MSHDSPLPAVAAPTLAGNTATIETKTPPISGSSSPAEPTPASPMVINPTLRLDAALGLVVIEFRNDNGVITTSIPSQQQLEAYQRWTHTKHGPAPAGGLQIQQPAPLPTADTTSDESTQPGKPAKSAVRSGTG